MTEPINAAQAAQLAAQAQQGHATRNRDAIRPALEHADTQIREAASGPAGLTAVQLDLRPFALTPDQLLAVRRNLTSRGFQVQAFGGVHDVLNIGWARATTRCPALPGQQHLTEIGDSPA